MIAFNTLNDVFPEDKWACKIAESVYNPDKLGDAYTDDGFNEVMEFTNSLIRHTETTRKLCKESSKRFNKNSEVIKFLTVQLNKDKASVWDYT